VLNAVSVVSDSAIVAGRPSLLVELCNSLESIDAELSLQPSYTEVSELADAAMLESVVGMLLSAPEQKE
jgi:hypothetical protein